MADPDALAARGATMGTLEDTCAQRATDELRTELTALPGRITALWTSAFGLPDAPAGAELTAVRAALTAALRGAEPDAAAALRSAVPLAAALGVTQAREQLGPDAQHAAMRAHPDQVARVALDDAVGVIAAILAERRAAAVALLRPELVRTLGQSGVLAAIAQAQQAVTRLDAHARTTVVTTVADGVREVADAAGLPRLWVAERDACLTCTRLAGVVCGPDGTWSAAATYGQRLPPARGALRGPPRHPRCRCQVMPYTANRDVEYATALAREARRSVLRGCSRPSEPEAARLRAADRLLDRISPEDAPASVRAAARRAVARGKFPGRRVPTNPVR